MNKYKSGGKKLETGDGILECISFKVVIAFEVSGELKL